MLIDEEAYLKKGIDEFLEHHGVKGQKWGVRQQRRLTTARSVAKGKGTFGEKVSVRGTNSVVSNLRNPLSAKNLASRNLTALEARKKRMQSGQTKVLDILDKFALVRV